MATGPCTSGNTCPGVFTGTLSGLPLGSADVTFDVLVGPFASIGGRFGTRLDTGVGEACFGAIGSGQMNGGALTLTLNGTFCTDATTYDLHGAVQIYTTNPCPSSFQWTAMSGTFDAFGDVHTSGPTPTPLPTPTPTLINPMPSGVNHALVSIIGAAGQIPAPCPSP